MEAMSASASRKLSFFLLLQCFLGSLVLSAQTESQELLVRLLPGEKVPKAAQLESESLVPALNIHLFRYADEPARDAAATRLAYTSGVLSVEPNHLVDFRVEPNDDRYDEDQGNLRRVGYDKAWDLTAGGRTSEGEEIVVAILDAGFDVTHLDLRANLWQNTFDTPGDFIDNDNNGYVDDVFGWNMAGGNNVIPSDVHGTSVIGILGAKGDNGLGIAGTNWDLKMMLFSIANTADIVEAYGYVLEQRRRYNASNGAEGALVVATNASFGVRNTTCTDFPVWGGMYEELGRVGVLTAAGAVNEDLDVDRFGDMPTDCPTDFLVTVTNLDTEDRLWQNAGYGRETVDLAAPGEGSFSTRPSGTYGPFSRNSAATPYVTGAIALLYSTPCPDFLETMRSDPAGAALFVRDVILSGTTPNPGLEFRTSSGGSLDVAEAQRLFTESCELGDRETFDFTDVFPVPAQTTLTLQTNTLVFSESAVVDLFDPLGRLVRSQQPLRVSSAPVRLEINVAGLPAGWYSLRLQERGRVVTTSIVIE